MRTVSSKDGTTIAYDVHGDGARPLVIVDGATSHRAVNPLNGEIGRLLGDDFRVYAYDRRGRGDSTDTPPYAVEREIEDLAALIDVAGGSAMVCGFSSGAVLCLDAAAAGLPITRLVLFEPPFVVDVGRPPLPADYVQRLEGYVAAGRPDDAAAFFMGMAANMPEDMVDGVRRSPFFAPVVAVAHTIAYDGRIMGSTMSGTPLPTDRWAKATVPTLVLHGDRTEPWLASGSRAVAEVLPSATVRAVPGEQHSAPADVLAAALREFAAS
jgi:pimeloyl-ACP methyl ester carboxylesterase